MQPKRWRVKAHPNNYGGYNWFLFTPANIPIDVRSSFEKAQYFFPIVAKQYLENRPVNSSRLAILKEIQNDV